MPYWAAARLQPNREALALHFLHLNGFTTYLPRLRERRVKHGRWFDYTPPLFPGYAFVSIELQWHNVRWGVGIIGLIMNGLVPAHVPDAVIAAIRKRERGGYVELLKPRGLQPGDQVRITHGLLQGKLGLYQGMRPQQRVEILLAVLGRVTLPKGDIEAV
jgi:transcriptional antiterminator RfaH